MNEMHIASAYEGLDFSAAEYPGGLRVREHSFLDGSLVVETKRQASDAVGDRFVRISQMDQRRLVDFIQTRLGVEPEPAPEPVDEKAIKAEAYRELLNLIGRNDHAAQAVTSALYGLGFAPERTVTFAVEPFDPAQF